MEIDLLAAKEQLTLANEKIAALERARTFGENMHAAKLKAVKTASTALEAELRTVKNANMKLTSQLEG